MAGGAVRRAAYVGVALVAHVLAHNLVFLAEYGNDVDAALARTGHGPAWDTAVAIILAIGCGLLLAAAWRLRQLGVLARATAPDGRIRRRRELRVRGLDRRRFLGHLAGIWWRLVVVMTLLFVAQENAERLMTGEGLPGLDVITAGGQLISIPIVVLVALVVATVVALFRWRRDVLAARIRGLASLRRRPAAALRTPFDPVDRRPRTLLGRGLSVRAPPFAFR